MCLMAPLWSTVNSLRALRDEDVFNDLTNIKIPTLILYGVHDTICPYPFAEYMDPPLTVVDIDTYKLGEEAANTLFSIIQNLGQHRKEVLLSTRIIERESTMKGEKRKK